MCKWPVIAMCVTCALGAKFAPEASALDLPSLAPVPKPRAGAPPPPAAAPAPVLQLQTPFGGVYPRRTVVCRLGRRAVSLILAGLSKTAHDEEKEQGSRFLFVRKGLHEPVLAAGGKQMALTFLKKTGSNPYCKD